VILPPNIPPVASFFFSPTAPRENETIQFDASTSSDADGKIESYVWTFGDGSSASGVRPTHRYEVAGTYNVILTVKDDRGAQVSSAPTPVSVLVAPNPVANFTVSPTDPLVNDIVAVDASASTVPAGRSIVGYSWNFGNGKSGTGRNATVVYDRASTYTIVLTVTDDTGRTGVTSRTVQVK